MTPQEETLEGYGRLIKAGKVRSIGASNYTADRLSDALRISRDQGLPRYETLQPLYNLSDRADFEGSLQNLCVEAKIGSIPYFSLAAGFLTGKYRTEADFTKSARGANMARRLNDRGRRILAALDTIAAEHGATQAQVALAWLMVQPSVTAPIASATSVEQLHDILGATRLTLSPDQLEALDQASASP